MSGQKFMSSLVIILLGFGIIFSNPTAFAQSLLPEGSIFVSEINWDGSWVLDIQTKTYKSDSSDEWIELYNPSDSIFDLASITIKGAASSGKDLQYKDLSKCKINPKSYLVVSRLANSATLNGLSVCQASNMSLSNSSLNIIISSKDGAIQETQFMGNPSALITDKSQNSKFSIEKVGEIWIQSKSNIDLIGLGNPLNQPYHHFGSPGYTDFGFIVDMSETLEAPTLPVNLNPKMKSIDKIDITKQEFSLGASSCDFVPFDYQENITIETIGSYCLKVKFEISVSGLAYIGFLDFVFEVKSKAPLVPKIEGVVVTEVDLNEDRVELYNSNDYEINLSEYTFEDVIGSVKKSKLVGFVLKQKEYTLLDVKTLGITLNNSGDNIILKDVQDNVITQSNSKIGKTLTEDHTWQYFSDSKDWEDQVGTLGRENERSLIVDISETKTQDVKNETVSKGLSYYEDKIRINEVYPQGEEYVELYNKGDNDLDISGLVLHDETGKTGKAIFDKNTILGGKKYLTAPLKGKISLNNDGDGVVLMTSLGEIVDKISYDFAREKNLSYQYFADGWFWEEKTQGLENVKIAKNLDQSNSNSAQNEKDEKKKTCQELSILTQTSKNMYFSNLGKIYLADVPKERLPQVANICTIRPKDDYKQGVFDVWVKPFTINPEVFNDSTKKINEFSFVNFNLRCKGKKNADIIREDVIFRSIYQVKKPECLNQRVGGLGLVFTLDENYIIYFVNQEKQNSVSQNKVAKTKNSRIKSNPKTITDESQEKTSKTNKLKSLVNNGKELNIQYLMDELVKLIQVIFPHG